MRGAAPKVFGPVCRAIGPTPHGARVGPDALSASDGTGPLMSDRNERDPPTCPPGFGRRGRGAGRPLGHATISPATDGGRIARARGCLLRPRAVSPQQAPTPGPRAAPLAGPSEARRPAP